MSKFEELLSQHEELLKKLNNPDRVNADLVGLVSFYLQAACQGGTEIALPIERAHTEANLRFWASFLYEQQGKRPITLLAPPSPEAIQKARKIPLSVALQERQDLRRLENAIAEADTLQQSRPLDEATADLLQQAREHYTMVRQKHVSATTWMRSGHPGKCWDALQQIQNFVQQGQVVIWDAVREKWSPAVEIAEEAGSQWQQAADGEYRAIIQDVEASDVDQAIDRLVHAIEAPYLGQQRYEMESRLRQLQKVQSLLERAEAAFYNNDLLAAQDLFADALQLHPDQRIESRLRAVQERDIQNVILEAGEVLHQEEYEKARQIIRLALGHYSGGPYQSRLKQVLGDIEKKQRAREELASLLQTAEMLHKDGRYGEARLYLEQVLAQWPGELNAVRMLQNVNRAAEIEEMLKAIRTAGQEADYRRAEEIASQALERYPDKEIQVREALENARRNDIAFLMKKADERISLASYGEARELLREIMARYPEERIVRERLRDVESAMEAQYMLERAEDAVRAGQYDYARQLIEGAKGIPLYGYHQARCQELLDRARQGQAAHQRIQQMLQQADLLANEGRYRDGIELLRQVQSDVPDYSQYRAEVEVMLAELRAREQRQQEARQLLELAQKSDDPWESLDLVFKAQDIERRLPIPPNLFVPLTEKVVAQAEQLKPEWMTCEEASAEVKRIDYFITAVLEEDLLPEGPLDFDERLRQVCAHLSQLRRQLDILGSLLPGMGGDRWIEAARSNDFTELEHLREKIEREQLPATIEVKRFSQRLEKEKEAVDCLSREAALIRTLFIEAEDFAAVVEKIRRLRAEHTSAPFFEEIGEALQVVDLYQQKQELRGWDKIESEAGERQKELDAWRRWYERLQQREKAAREAIQEARKYPLPAGLATNVSQESSAGLAHLSLLEQRSIWMKALQATNAAVEALAAQRPDQARSREARKYSELASENSHYSETLSSWYSEAVYQHNLLSSWIADNPPPTIEDLLEAKRRREWNRLEWLLARTRSYGLETDEQRTIVESLAQDLSVARRKKPAFGFLRRWIGQ